MANPFAFAGTSFPYDDHILSSHPYPGLVDGLEEPGMTYVGSNIQYSPPSPYGGGGWDAPVERFLKDTQKTLFFVANVPTQPDNTSNRPTVGISPVPRYSQARLASPVSSIEPSSAASARSPPADTEPLLDNFPRTPPDTVLLSPFQASLPREPYSNAPDVQFASGGFEPDYVNLFDVNPSQQSDYGESNNGVVDFSFSQPAYIYDDRGAGQSDTGPAHATPVSNCSVPPAGLPEPAPVKEVSNPSAEYAPVPTNEAGVNSDDEVLPDEQDGGGGGGGDDDDDADTDYRPTKKQKTSSTRISARRKIKTSTASSTAPQRTRRRRSRALPSTTPAAPSSSGTTVSPVCPECSDRGFRSQADLDAHVEKEHLRPFNCVFDFAGCDATFPNKNEWKRHVQTQHLVLTYWVCHEGSCSSITNDRGTTTGKIFNRKDLFTQHLRRMHKPQEVRDHLKAAGKRRCPSSTTTSSSSSSSSPSSSSSNATTATAANPTPTSASASAAVTGWEARERALQISSRRQRCRPPALLGCPVPGCAASSASASSATSASAGPPAKAKAKAAAAAAAAAGTKTPALFRGPDPWNQRMEHVAKHMERAARGLEPRVVFGTREHDAALVAWASREDVGIIVPVPGPKPATRNDGGTGLVPGEREEGYVDGALGGEGSGDGGTAGSGRWEWVLESVLEKGPSGTSSVRASARYHHHGGRGGGYEADQPEQQQPDEEEEEDGEVEGEIVVSGDGVWGGEDEDAEGEDD